MKFFCPSCNMERKIEISMTDCVVSETIEFDDDGVADYGVPEIHDSVNSRYQCYKCGWVVPVEPCAVDDDALFDWLKEQPYNRRQSCEKDRDLTEEGLRNELFRLLKQTGHAAVRFCNWTLDLQEMRNYPPFGLTGYCCTTYQGHDLSLDKDLRDICRDFVRTALYSRRHQEETVSLEFITAPNIEEL